MTYAEIVEARLRLAPRESRNNHIFAPDLPEWQQSQIERGRDEDRCSSGVIRQKCGGGVRILRHKIGGD